jgi:feruloyl esterase
MIRYRTSLGLTSFLLTSSPFAGNSAFAASCESLSSLKLPDTTIAMALPVAANTFAPRAGAKPVPVAFCRVAGSIKPTSDSDIKFEVWLPQAGWTGRYESVGDGGFAEAISLNEMVTPLRLAQPARARTMEHESAKNTQTEWAVGHPEKLIDFAYRAVHVTAEVGKAVTAAFYGSKPKYSYFIGCSMGGREALTEAQRYPADFDGISAGDPGNQWASQHAGDAANMKAFTMSKAGYISPADIQKVGAAVIEQCDAVDGIKDGLISDPRQCRINTATLPLTPAQLKTYQTVHDGPKTSTGKQIFPGMPYSSESVGWVQYFAGPSFVEAPTKARRALMANSTFSNLVYHDPNWTFMSYDPDKTPVDIQKTMGPIIDAMNPTFTGFKARGGKLISYHGWADSDISPFSTVDFYNSSIAAQGGLDKTQDVYRLFMVPGMGHCGGGPGPNQFGQAGGDGGADHDVVTAPQQWVEKGVAPKKIIATKFVDNDRTKVPQMTRPLCVFRETAKYKGTGDINNADNFACANPDVSKQRP